MLLVLKKFALKLTSNFSLSIVFLFALNKNHFLAQYEKSAEQETQQHERLANPCSLHLQ